CLYEARSVADGLPPCGKRPAGALVISCSRAGGKHRAGGHHTVTLFPQKAVLNRFVASFDNQSEKVCSSSLASLINLLHGFAKPLQQISPFQSVFPSSCFLRCSVTTARVPC